jgi:hypothetical protein
MMTCNVQICALPVLLAFDKANKITSIEKTQKHKTIYMNNTNRQKTAKLWKNWALISNHSLKKTKSMATQFVQRPQTFPSLWKRHGGKASAPPESQRRWRRGICQTNFQHGMEKKNRTVWRSHIGLLWNAEYKSWVSNVGLIIIQQVDIKCDLGRRPLKSIALQVGVWDGKIKN